MGKVLAHNSDAVYDEYTVYLLGGNLTDILLDIDNEVMSKKVDFYSSSKEFRSEDIEWLEGINPPHPFDDKKDEEKLYYDNLLNKDYRCFFAGFIHALLENDKTHFVPGSLFQLISEVCLDMLHYTSIDGYSDSQGFSDGTWFKQAIKALDYHYSSYGNAYGFLFFVEKAQQYISSFLRTVSFSNKHESKETHIRWLSLLLVKLYENSVNDETFCDLPIEWKVDMTLNEISTMDIGILKQKAR